MYTHLPPGYWLNTLQQPANTPVITTPRKLTPRPLPPSVPEYCQLSSHSLPAASRGSQEDAAVRVVEGVEHLGLHGVEVGEGVEPLVARVLEGGEGQGVQVQQLGVRGVELGEDQVLEGQRYH